MFEYLRTRRDERALALVPKAVLIAFALALALQVALSLALPRETPSAAALKPPPSVAAVIATSLGDTLAAAKIMNLLLQAQDNQPGLSIPFAQLDYLMLTRWLERIVELDPTGPYPLLAASRLYGEVPDPARQRLMLSFVQRQFHADPNRRWPALAHAAHVARHGLKDMGLAREFAASLRREATGPGVPAWARQMEILLLADMNEPEAARVLLGALLDSGEVTDPSEFAFLSRRLAEIADAAKAATAAPK